RRAVPDHRRGDAADPVRSRAEGRAGARRLDRHQCVRSDPPRPASRPWSYDRDHSRRFRHPLPIQAVQPRISEGARSAAAPMAGGGQGMTELLFRDDGYLRSASARVTAADARGIRLDRTVFYPTGGGQPGDSGLLRLSSGQAIAIVDTVKGDTPDEVIHIPAP